MATGKRYYWIKLKETFMTSDAVDFLMSQPDGANYVVLYQMLCLKTINTDGKLERHIGEVVIPYDIEKIQRDTKWFSIDTVRVALDLYKSLGLIYKDQNGTLALSNYDNLVGSETDWAVKKRRQNLEKSTADVPLLSGESGGENFPIEIDIENRDKILEIRDKEIDIRESEYNTRARARAREEHSEKESFKPPTLDEVIAFSKERNSKVDPKRFFDFFDTGHWIDSRGSPVLNWKQKFISWERDEEDKGKKPAAKDHSFTPTEF